VISGGSGMYNLVFTSSASAAGTVVIAYTLSNGWGTSVPATVTFTVVARPDPTQDPEVSGLLNAQAQSAQQLAGSQIRNFNDRLERLHSGTGRQNGSMDVRMSFPQRRPAPDDPTAFVETAQPSNAMDRAFGPFNTPDAKGLEALPKPTATPAPGDDDGGPMFWAGGFVNFGNNKSQDLDISQTMIGMSGGVDVQVSNDFIAGIGFGYGRSSADVGENGTNTVGQAFSAALYGSYNTGSNIFIDGLLGYGYLDFDSDRYVTDTGAFASGSRDGSQIFGSITASYEYSTGPLLLSPYGRVQTAWSQLNGFQEAGGGYYNLIYGEQTITTVAGVIGLRSEYIVPTSWSVLTARGRLEYTHNFTGDSNAAMGYADLGTGLPYSLEIDPMDSNYATVGVGLDAKLPNGVVFGFNYQGMIGFDGEDVSQTLMLRASTRF